MANKEYKSDVFSMLLQDKNRALEVYNAINGTDYDDPEMVEMTTLDDKSFSLTVRNDASFILDANLSLYEHQSTYCPNMPHAAERFALFCKYYSETDQGAEA